jgi:hypothetical protein
MNRPDSSTTPPGRNRTGRSVVSGAENLPFVLDQSFSRFPELARPDRPTSAGLWRKCGLRLASECDATETVRPRPTGGTMFVIVSRGAGARNRDYASWRDTAGGAALSQRVIAWPVPAQTFGPLNSLQRQRAHPRENVRSQQGLPRPFWRSRGLSHTILMGYRHESGGDVSEATRQTKVGDHPPGLHGPARRVRGRTI